MTKRVLPLFLLLLLLADIGYSFWQHYNVALDGDMANIILPSPAFQQVLEDPFGWQILLTGEGYAATNRFFAHWLMSSYFKTIPQLLQYLVHPVESIYLASALFKTAVQVFILLVLAKYVTESLRPAKSSLLAAMMLITPLFHTFGYNKYMGIIDQSITYTFFYAFPLGLLLLFFFPLFRAVHRQEFLRWNIGQLLLFLLLTVVLPFSGSLVPGIVLLVSFCLILTSWKKQLQVVPPAPFLHRALAAIPSIPGLYYLYLLPISLLSLYSLYIGQYNSENFHATIPVLERYARMPVGLFGMLTNKLGLPLLLLMVILNYQIIRRQFKYPSGQKLLTVHRWVLLVSLVYLLVLPLGGYREYRYYIVRYDTIMPIVLGLMYLYGASAYYLIILLRGTLNKLYIAGNVAFLLIFTIGDGAHPDHNDCEKNALYEIAQADAEVVQLTSDCPILGWEKISVPEASELNARLLELWGITRERKLYYSIE